MEKTFSRTASVTFSFLALLLSTAALTVSLLQAGPQGQPGERGPHGPQGPSGTPPKENQMLGLCVDMDYGSVGYISGVYSPVRTNGVVSCPVGDFTPVKPQAVP